MCVYVYMRTYVFIHMHICTCSICSYSSLAMYGFHFVTHVPYVFVPFVYLMFAYHTQYTTHINLFIAAMIFYLHCTLVINTLSKAHNSIGDLFPTLPWPTGCWLLLIYAKRAPS